MVWIIPAGSGSPNGTDYFKAFQSAGYQVIYNNTELKTVDTSAYRVLILVAKGLIYLTP